MESSNPFASDEPASLLLGALVLTGVDGLSAVLGILAVDGAAEATAGAEHLKDGPLELLGVGAGTHGAGHTVHIIPGDVAIVGDVLHLLAVPRGLLEGLNDKSSRGRHDLDGHLAVLHEKLAGHVHALPLLGGLAEVLANRLGGQLHRTHFRGERWHWRHLATRNANYNDLNLGR